MKIVIKKLIKYSLIGIPVQFLMAGFHIANVPYASTIFSLSFLLYILFDIGRSIKSESARKKYIIYMGIIMGEIILLSILGNVFGFKTYVSSETENSFLDALSASIIFWTITGILIKIVYDCKNKYPAIKLLYFPISLLIFMLITTWFLI